jgi:DNA mismatch repair ATPase MutL
MKYCPNCGNEVRPGQAFCNKCGNTLKKEIKQAEPSSQGKQETQATQSKQTYPDRNRYTPQPNKKDKKPIWIIILSIIFILLIGALLYGAYYYYNNVIKDNDSDNQTTETQKKSKDDSQSKESSSSEANSSEKAPTIDVFSSNFDQGYMKSASTEGYKGIYKDMTRKEVEAKFGKSSGKVHGGQTYYEKYGDLAVLYSGDKVDRVGVAPSNVTEDEFLDHYYEPDERKSDELIYDSNKDNDFSVIAHSKKGKITLIENIDQL